VPDPRLYAFAGNRLLSKPTTPYAGASPFSDSSFGVCVDPIPAESTNVVAAPSARAAGVVEAVGAAIRMPSLSTIVDVRNSNRDVAVVMLCE
jgi:hypothetical protein